MKVLINPYSTVFQKKGGIQKRLLEHHKMLKELKIESKIFDVFDDINKYDVVTTFKPMLSNYNVFYYAKSLGKKTVTHAILNNEKSSFQRLKYRIPHTIANLNYKMINESDIIIATSNNEKLEIEKRYNVEKKVVVIPNAVNDSIFTISRKEIFLDKYNITNKYILMVGRIEENKNQNIVVEIAHSLGINVIIIGGISDNKYYEKIKNYSNCMIIKDIEYGSELLVSAYQNAELFILPSKNEISPNTVIEASLTGVPVICTRNNMSINEYFGNTIEYIEPLSKYSITNKIKSVLCADKNNKLHKKIALEIFGWNQVKIKYADLYLNIIQ